MDDKREYVQISIFDILENQNKQPEQKPYSVCDHCKAYCRFCYECKHLEDDE